MQCGEVGVKLPLGVGEAASGQGSISRKFGFMLGLVAGDVGATAGLVGAETCRMKLLGKKEIGWVLLV